MYASISSSMISARVSVAVAARTCHSCSSCDTRLQTRPPATKSIFLAAVAPGVGVGARALARGGPAIGEQARAHQRQRRRRRRRERWIWFGARGARGCCTAGRPRAVHLGLRQDVQEKNNGSRHSKRFMDHVFSPKPGDGGVLKVHIVSSSRDCLWLGAALSPRGRCTAPRAGQRSPFSTLSKTRKDAAWRSAASAPRRRVRRRTSTTGPVPSGAGGVRLRGLQREARQHPRLREADGPIWARDRTALGGAHAEPAVGRLGRRRHRYNRPAAARSWHRRCATRRDSYSVCVLWRVRAIEYI